MSVQVTSALAGVGVSACSTELRSLASRSRFAPFIRAIRQREAMRHPNGDREYVADVRGNRKSETRHRFGRRPILGWDEQVVRGVEVLDVDHLASQRMRCPEKVLVSRRPVRYGGSSMVRAVADHFEHRLIPPPKPSTDLREAHEAVSDV